MSGAGGPLPDRNDSMRLIFDHAFGDVPAVMGNSLHRHTLVDTEDRRSPYSPVQCFGEQEISIQGPDGSIVCRVEPFVGETDAEHWERARGLAKLILDGSYPPMSLELSSRREAWKDMIAAAILVLVGFVAGVLLNSSLT